MSGQLPQVPNYLPNIQSPFTAAVQGLQFGQAVGEAVAAPQQRENMQSAMQAFQRNPSPQTLTPLLTSLPPQTAEVLRKHWEGMETGQRESNIAFGGQAMSAILAGRADLAGDLFMQRATALENAGRADEAKFNRDMAELVKVNPQFALAFGASTFGASEGGERMLRNILAATREPVAQRGAVADVQQKETEAAAKGAQIAADIAAKRATTAATISQLQRDAQSNGVTIDSNSMGLLNTSVREATEATSDANRMANVARRIEDGINTQGAPAAARAALERFMGSGEFVKLRTEYNNLRNNALIRQLGPMTGASSDKDVALFMSGFIDENAAPETLASFLRGMEKVSRADAATRQSRASWISNFGSLRDATRETSIGGFAVQPGSSFVDFEKNYSQFLLGFNRQGTAQEPSYMRFAPRAGQ
jgi:hypothetical protein